MVGCRVEPDLKELLENEATQTDKTLSAYLEGILKQRHYAENDVGKLKERIFELETQNAALQSRSQTVRENENVSENTIVSEAKLLAQDVEIRTLKQQKMEITDFYKRATEERDVLAKLHGKVIPHWISESNYNLMGSYLNQLVKLKPKLSHERVLVASLATTLHNEKSNFTVYRISDFLSRNPHFFTFKTASKQ